ncbi:MAG: dihydrodipicolinate synthase family protein [Spirochaetota bacterium]
MNYARETDYRGVFCPVFTPFRESGEVDVEAAGVLYDHLIEGGVDGIVILGSMGEFQAIPLAERHRLIRFAVEHVRGRCKLIVGTGGTVLEDVTALTRFSEEAGADAVMSIPPYYAPVTDEGVLAYYDAIADASKLPVLLYNFPARTGYGIPARIVGELARRHEQIVGLKDTVDSISHTREVIREVLSHRRDFAVLSGFDEYIFVNLLSGGAGTVNGLTNLVPALFRRGFDAFEAGDLATMQEVQALVVKLMALYTLGPNFVATFKYAISRLIPAVKPLCAPPEPPLDPERRRTLDALLDETGVIAERR